MPSMERIRFVSSGTEAAMSALRVARAATGRDAIIKFEGCYHGHADAFLVQAGSGAMTLGVPTSPGVSSGAARDTLLARYNDLASVEARLRNATRNRSPPSSSSRSPATWASCRRKPGFLEGLRALCDREHALLVFDEVISGFRAATGGAQQLYGIRPDLTCLGKIIGGGLPVGAYGGRADIMELVAPAGPVYQAGTLSGNPLAMTAGLWSLQELSPKLYATWQSSGAMLAAGLADAARDAGVAAAGERVRIDADAVLHDRGRRRLPVGAQRPTRRRYGRFFHAMLGARHLSAAVAVRGVVPVGGAHRARRRSDDQGGARRKKRCRSAV